jgi:hypothetical protein
LKFFLFRDDCAGILGVSYGGERVWKIVRRSVGRIDEGIEEEVSEEKQRGMLEKFVGIST